MATVAYILLLMMVGCNCVSSDFAEDEKECQEKLIRLSPCLSFVGGETNSKAPTPQCCTQLRNGINNSRRCLCILVKDRNEPGLGFKINATLALILPSLCHAPANASDCVALLHLAPNSTDAQVFEQFASNNEGNGTIAGTSSSSSNAARGRRWLGLQMVGAVSVWFLVTLHHWFF